MALGNSIHGHNHAAKLWVSTESGLPEGDPTCGTLYDIILGLLFSEVDMPDTFQLYAVADDIRIFMPLEDADKLAGVIDQIETVGKKFNQTLRRDKCKLVHVGADVTELPMVPGIPSLDLQIDSLDSLGMDCTQNPEKQLDKVKAVVEKMLEYAAVYMRVVAPFDVQVALYMLRTCVIPRVTDALRAVPPTVELLEYLGRVDKEIDDLLDIGMQVPVKPDGEPLCDLHVRKLRRMPLKQGGLGIPNLAVVAKATWLGAVAQTKTMLEKAEIWDKDHSTHGPMQQLCDKVAADHFAALINTENNGSTSFTTTGQLPKQSALTVYLHIDNAAKWDEEATDFQKKHRAQLSDSLTRKGLATPYVAGRNVLVLAGYSYRYVYVSKLETRISDTPVVRCASHPKENGRAQPLITDFNGGGDLDHLVACKGLSNMPAIRHKAACSAVEKLLTVVQYSFESEVTIEKRAQAAERLARERATQRPRPARAGGRPPRQEKPSDTRVDGLYNDMSGTMQGYDITICRIKPGESLDAWSERVRKVKEKRYAGPTHSGRKLKVHPLVFTPLGMPDKGTRKWIDDLRKKAPDADTFSRKLQRLSNEFFKFICLSVAPRLGWSTLKADAFTPVITWQHV